MCGVNGACCAHEGYGTRVGTEEKYVGEIIFFGIEGIDLARSQHPQPQVRSGIAFEVVEHERFLVRYHGGRSVTTVVEQRCPRSNGLFDGGCGCRIGETGRSRHARVIIPVDFVDGEAIFTALRDRFAHSFGIFGVLIGVAVIGHHDNPVFPRTRVFIFEVAFHFVHENLGLLLGGAGHTAGGEIYFFRVDVFPLAIIKQSIEVIGHKTADGADALCGCVVFVGQQVVVYSGIFPFLCDEAVVPGTFSHQEQVAGRFVGSGSSVIEHFQIAAQCIGVGGAGRKFIVEQVSRNHFHTQTALAVEFGESLRLCGEFPAGRHSNDVVDVVIGMQILIGHATDGFRQGIFSVGIEDDKAALRSVGGERTFSVAFLGKREGCRGTTHLSDAPYLRMLPYSTDLQRRGHICLRREAIGLVRYGEQTRIVDGDIVQSRVVALGGDHVDGVGTGQNGVFKHRSVGAGRFGQAVVGADGRASEFRAVEFELGSGGSCCRRGPP